LVDRPVFMNRPFGYLVGNDLIKCRLRIRAETLVSHLYWQKWLRLRKIRLVRSACEFCRAEAERRCIRVEGGSWRVERILGHSVGHLRFWLIMHMAVMVHVRIMDVVVGLIRNLRWLPLL